MIQLDYVFIFICCLFLKGTIDQTGVIDSWPAHNSRPSNMQLALNKNNNLIISNLMAEGKPDITPKVN